MLRCLALDRNFHSFTKLASKLWVDCLTINPRNEIEFVGIEHVSNLEFSVEDSRFSEDIDESFIREIVQAIKLVGDNGRNLKHLTISFPMFPCWINLELSRFLGDAFIDILLDAKDACGLST